MDLNLSLPYVPKSLWQHLCNFVAFDAGQLEFTSGFPKYFKSSDIAKRGFCSECGSPIVLVTNH